ncbi:MAG: hypothetical protein Q8Q59_11855 [Luteolibacter sp.]|jgi:hypothetical protein|nr:hypothetical protein [Luteolibacter sp.]
MKPTTLPLFCGVATAAMSAAGLSHWWSVREFIAALDAGAPVSIPSVPVERPAPAAQPVVSKPVAAVAAVAKNPKPTAPPAAGQEQFYETLISRMESLQNQNRDLLDQLAETNRDVMKLEFRVDTHSESFRPLPVTEDRPFTSLESELGVLPPRAEPVDLPDHE